MEFDPAVEDVYSQARKVLRAGERLSVTQIDGHVGSARCSPESECSSHFKDGFGRLCL